MSYNNNDEQARRAQAARNAQWASNSSQPQNLAPYQTGGYANLNEPRIHTTGTVPMNLLNTPSSHSVIPDVPHNPAPLPLTYQSPIRQQESHRTVLENTTYDQGGSSRGPPDVGYGAQPRGYYGQAPQNPGLGPSGSSQRPPDVGYGAQPRGYYGQAPQNPGLGPSGNSQRPPDVGYGAQPRGYYGQAPQNPAPGPSGKIVEVRVETGKEQKAHAIIRDAPSLPWLLAEDAKNTLMLRTLIMKQESSSGMVGPHDKILGMSLGTGASLQWSS
ncbi:hypothetical protein FBULB1_8554 [Fusarium bulbicola]|nr:hypothetical protein FBULB1_8554 [Fusarium bulbicola]